MFEVTPVFQELAPVPRNSYDCKTIEVALGAIEVDPDGKSRFQWKSLPGAPAFPAVFIKSNLEPKMFEIRNR